MKKFQRIIIALDNTDFDETLIKYASRFTEHVQAEKIYFVYVERDLELPKGLRVKYKDVHGNEIPRDELLRKVVKHKVQEHFSHPSDVQLEVEVLEGSPLERLLHWIKVKEADLMILGNKRVSEGSGVLARKVARNSDCALLFVPEESGLKDFKKLLVPVDFSDFSKPAMRKALNLATKAKSKEGITALHVFDIPMQGYPTINFNYDNFVKSVIAFKMEAFKKYISQFDTEGVGVKDVYIENDPPGIAKKINKYAQEHTMDLIVMGAQGHSLLERVLLGSVAEKLVTIDKAVPVLILRK